MILDPVTVDYVQFENKSKFVDYILQNFTKFI